MSLSAPIRQGQLAVDPPAAAVAVAPGALAVVEARLEVRLSPRPMKGAVEVASSDPAFSIVQVHEVRRAERWVTIEVSGAHEAPAPRAVTLTYTVDGLSAEQTVTISPTVADAPERPASQRYVPFEDDPPTVRDTTATLSEPVAGWARIDDTPAPLESETEIDVAPGLIRIAAAFAELAAAALVTIGVSFVVIVAAAGPMVAICGEDPAGGTGCGTADSVIINSIVAYVFFGIPLYHAITAMFGGGIAYRLIGLRIVCRGAWLARPLREELDHARPGFLRGLLRTLLFYFGALCFALGHLWIFTNQERRGWHDLAAGTIVVRSRG